MPKIDDQFAAIEAGYVDAEVHYGYSWVEDAQMENLKVRRKNATQTHHKLAYLSIGERGQPATATFWGHKFSDVLKKALEWRGQPTGFKRKPRSAAPAA